MTQTFDYAGLHPGRLSLASLDHGDAAPDQLVDSNGTQLGDTINDAQKDSSPGADHLCIGAAEAPAAARPE
jgi:hypothetical protein